MFNIDEPLPEEQALFPLDKFLYKSSLFFYQDRPRHCWQYLVTPILSFLFALVFCVQRIIVVFYGDNKLVIFAFGDVTDVIGLRFHLNFCMILLASNSLFLQLVFYRNYRKGIKPTFLKVSLKELYLQLNLAYKTICSCNFNKQKKISYTKRLVEGNIFRLRSHRLRLLGSKAVCGGGGKVKLYTLWVLENFPLWVVGVKNGVSHRR